MSEDLHAAVLNAETFEQQQEAAMALLSALSEKPPEAESSSSDPQPEQPGPTLAMHHEDHSTVLSGE